MDSGAFSFDGAPVPAGVTVADHAPGIAATDVTFGPNCPVAHDATVFDMRSKPVAGGHCIWTEIQAIQTTSREF